MATTLKGPRLDIARFLTAFIQRDNNVWVTSAPGAWPIRYQAATSAAKPIADELQAKGYKVTSLGCGKRLVPDGIVEHITRRSSEDGQDRTMELRHAGLIDVEQFALRV